LDNGPVATAIRASASIPGLFSPVEIDGKLLVLKNFGIGNRIIENRNK